MSTEPPRVPLFERLRCVGREHLLGRPRKARGRAFFSQRERLLCASPRRPRSGRFISSHHHHRVPPKHAHTQIARGRRTGSTAYEAFRKSNFPPHSHAPFEALPRTISRSQLSLSQPTGINYAFNPRLQARVAKEPVALARSGLGRRTDTL